MVAKAHTTSGAKHWPLLGLLAILRCIGNQLTPRNGICHRILWLVFTTCYVGVRSDVSAGSVMRASSKGVPGEKCDVREE